MFDSSLPEVADLAALDVAALIDAAAGWLRAENAACARKLAVLAELFTRRTGVVNDERDSWWIDPCAAVAAELGAAMGITPRLALAQTHRGVVLRERLPKVAALFEAGQISDLLARAIVARTSMITDRDVRAAIDADLAERVRAWGALPEKQTVRAIDELVLKHDPGALRRSRTAARSRAVDFGSPTDEDGFTSLWARLYATDGAALERRLDAMARSVCPDDPRTIDERRADAMGALAAGQELPCACGTETCSATDRRPAAPTAMIHVVADATTVAAARSEAEATRAARDANDSEAGHEPPPDAGHESAPDTTDQPAPDDAPAIPDPAGSTSPVQTVPAAPGPPPAHLTGPPAKNSDPPPAFIMGGGLMPAPLLATVLDRARVREIRHPGDAPPEDGYRPSAALAEFVRCRDLTCRFPGCDVPADRCDIDHTIPWPLGPTHAANLKCMCRANHLLKTFWGGESGWRDEQRPEGTVIWTSPTGHTYVTKPGSALLFPSLCMPTGGLMLPGTDAAPKPDAAGRSVMMPKRRRTRAQDLARRIAAERRLNDALVAERNKPPPF